MAKYILIERTSQWGKNGVTMWRLTFYCIDNGEIYEMTVDPSYRNFRRKGWDHVVECNNPYGVYTNLTATARTTREGRPVLSADSTPEIIYRCENRSEAIDLMNLDQDERTAATNYGKFFE
jgi:hypothetical protein